VSWHFWSTGISGLFSRQGAILVYSKDGLFGDGWENGEGMLVIIREGESLVMGCAEVRAGRDGFGADERSGRFGGKKKVSS